MTVAHQVVAKGYPAYEATVFGLLVVNTVLFAVDGSTAEGIDSIAWLTLFALFQLETAHAGWISSRHALTLVRAVRFVAGAAVLAAAVGYIGEEAWLDVVNAWLWIGVVVVLELEVRFPRAVAAGFVPVKALAALLYLSLGALVPIWAWRSEWFDAYDAALWLLAFATIEMNLLRAAKEPPASRAM